MAKRTTKKKAPAKRKAAAKKVAAPVVPPAVVDAAVRLLLTVTSRHQVGEMLAGEFHLSAPAVLETVDQAQRRLALAAGFDRTAELGRAAARLNMLFERADDPKVGLAIQRELSKLLRLYDAPAADSGADGDAADRATLEAELRAARAQLLPLNLAADETALAELCRLAVGRIVELERRTSNVER